MSLMDIIAENISDYDLPGLPAIAVVELEDNVCAIVHDASECKFSTPTGKNELAVSFVYDDTTSHAHDVICHYGLLSEVGECWVESCRVFTEALSLTPNMLDSEPRGIMRVDQPSKFWDRVEGLNYDYATDLKLIFGD